MENSKPLAIDELLLGEPHPPLKVSDRAENLLATLALLRQGRSTVEVVSRHLDPPIYADPSVCEEFKRLVLDNRRARVRILINDPEPIARSGHRLLDLARRLSSFFELRVPHPRHADYNSAFMLVDGTGLVLREFADRYEGQVSFGDRRTGRNLGVLFDEMWDLASPDPRLRQLSL